MTAMHDAKITVALATMNRPQQLRQCVAAILSGRTLPADIIIVDQSTDDRTAELVDASGWRAIAPIRYIRQERKGLASCRNTALVHATQPIVAFTDDDCVPDAGWLTALARAFEGNERPDAVTGRVLPLGPDRAGLYPVSARPSTTRAVHRSRSLPWAVGTGGNAAVRREWLNRVRGFDERLGIGSPGQSAEDLDLFYRLLRAGAVIQYEPPAVIFHARQPVEGRLSRAASYGFGMGAVCALWARQRDAYTLWIVLRWCVDRGDTLLRACLRRHWWRIREEWLTIDGARRGIAYGLRLAHEQPAAAGADAPFDNPRVREAVR
jgi:GT2 family glycosyltransferase